LFYDRGVERRRDLIEYREEPCKSALNEVVNMGFRWSLNPYMGCEHRCSFCYVRGFERRAERPSGDQYGRSIRVKTNIAAVLRAELGRRSWKREMVAIGAATDPYQPAEGRYRLTRACLEVLRDFANPTSLITRGTLILRDLELLVQLAECAELNVNFSVPTLDLEVWRRTEPGTPPPLQRLRALERLVKAGVKAGVGMAPILPGLSDRPEQLEEVVRAARAAGATHLWAKVLYLTPGTREHFFEVLSRHWPEMLDRYTELYNGRSHLPPAAKTGPERLVAELRQRHGVADRRTVRPAPPPPPQQLVLLN
jgi:DNA repair photolyase